MALKVINKILKFILKEIGSQCKVARIGEMWSNFFVPVRARAAAFWTSCKRWMDLLERQEYNELQ